MLRDPNWPFFIGGIVAIMALYFLYMKYFHKPVVRDGEPKTETAEKTRFTSKKTTVAKFENRHALIFVGGYAVIFISLMLLSLVKIHSDYPTVVTENLLSISILGLVALFFSVLLVLVKHMMFATEKPPKKVVTHSLGTPGIATPAIVTKVMTNSVYNGFKWALNLSKPILLSFLIFVGLPGLITGFETFVFTILPATKISALEATKLKGEALDLLTSDVEKAHSTTTMLISSLKNSDARIDLARVTNLGLAQEQFLDNIPSINLNCLTSGMKKADRQLALTAVENDLAKFFPITGTLSVADAVKSGAVSQSKWTITSGSMGQTQSLSRVTIANDAATLNVASPAKPIEICNVDAIVQVLDAAIGAIQIAAKTENVLIDKLDVAINTPATYSIWDVYTKKIDLTVTGNFLLLMCLVPMIVPLWRRNKYLSAKKNLAKVFGEHGLAGAFVTTTPKSYLIVPISKFQTASHFLKIIFKQPELTIITNDSTILATLNAAPERFGRPVTKDDVIYIATNDALERIDI